MTRLIGNKPRSDYEPDPQRALRRGLALDALLASTQAPRRFTGVLRASHRHFNEIDDQRALQLARRLNTRD